MKKECMLLMCVLITLFHIKTTKAQKPIRKFIKKIDLQINFLNASNDLFDKYDNSLFGLGFGLATTYKIKNKVDVGIRYNILGEFNILGSTSTRLTNFDIIIGKSGSSKKIYYSLYTGIGYNRFTYDGKLLYSNPTNNFFSCDCEFEKLRNTYISLPLIASIGMKLTKNFVLGVEQSIYINAKKRTLSTGFFMKTNLH